MAEPVLTGEITGDGILPVLTEIEGRRTSGVLEFEGPGASGSVALVAGEIAVDQKPMEDGRDPVEVLLELHEGTYRVRQRLPTLPVSKGDDLYRTGSLAVHVPADLMRYCEHAGMTGTLAFENGGRRADVVYEGGELVAIRVEGSGEDDLKEVFGWEEGTFEIRALTEIPEMVPEDVTELPGEPDQAQEGEEPAEPRPRRRDETGQIFLRSVEVALSSIVEEREKRRSPTRASPPLPPKPKARATDSFPGLGSLDEIGVPPPEKKGRRGRTTVRVIYLGARDEADGDEGMRHVRKDITAEVVLAEASPERRAKDGADDDEKRGEDEPRTEEDDGGASKAPEERQTSLLGTFAWVVVVFALMVLALALLAQLPALE